MKQYRRIGVHYRILNRHFLHRKENVWCFKGLVMCQLDVMSREICCMAGKQDTMERKTYINSSFQCMARSLGSSYIVVKRLLSACSMDFDYFRS